MKYRNMTDAPVNFNGLSDLYTIGKFDITSEEPQLAKKFVYS